MSEETVFSLPPADMPVPSIPKLPVSVDDDFLETEEDEPTVLAALKEDLKKEVTRDSIILQVPLRPNIAVTYSPNVTAEQLKKWTKIASRGKTNDFDGTVLASIVLGATCVGISINGKEATEDGEPMRFGSETFMAMVEASKVSDAVRALYGADSDIQAASMRVLEAAGFNQEPNEIDPLEMTTGSV